MHLVGFICKIATLVVVKLYKLREKEMELVEVKSIRSNCVTVSSVTLKNYWKNYHIYQTCLKENIREREQFESDRKERGRSAF